MSSLIHGLFLRKACVSKKQYHCKQYHRRTEQYVEHFEYGIYVARG